MLVLTALTAGPARAPGSAAGTAALTGWAKPLETHALVNGVAVAYCNRVGNEEGLTFWGGSRQSALTAWSRSQAALYDEQLLVVELDRNVGSDGIRRRLGSGRATRPCRARSGSPHRSNAPAGRHRNLRASA